MSFYSQAARTGYSRERIHQIVNAAEPIIRDEED